MQLGMKWIASRNRKSSPHIKEQNGIQTTTNPKCTSHPPKDQGKLDICCQVQWETHGKTYGRQFSHQDIFLREHNNSELWGADIEKDFHKANIHEKLLMIAGAEFEELEGFILVFNKILHGSEFVAAKTAIEETPKLSN